MISYYELLGMIKEDKAPKKIRLHLTSKPKIYKAVYDFGDFNYYTLYEEEIIDDDYKVYLSECFLESDMFEKNIEIIEEEKKIKQLETKKVLYDATDEPDRDDEFYLEDGNEDLFIGEKCQDETKIALRIIDKINEIIDKLNEVSE